MSKFTRPVLVVALAALTAFTAPNGATADQDPQQPPTATVTTTSPTGDIVNGSFNLSVDVNLAGASSVTLSPRFGSQYYTWTTPPAKHVTAQDCPTTCQVTWPIDTTSWGHAFYSTTAQAVVDWTTSDEVTGRTGWVGYYDAPVEPSWVSGYRRDVDASAATNGYAPHAFHTGGTVTASSTDPREAGEVMDVRVYTDSTTEAGGKLVLSEQTPWSSQRDAADQYTASAHLDTTNLPEGTYQLFMRPRNEAGQWGLSTGATLLVRHKPVVETYDASPAVQTVGANTYVGAAVNRPLANGVTWSALRVTVDGGPAHLISNLHWSVPGDASKPATTGAVLPVTLTNGTHTITTEVLDTRGRRIGSAGTSAVRAVTFTETATVPPLVLGLPSTVVLKGTAPAGLTYTSCYFGFYERSTMVAGGGACRAGATSYTQSVKWTPQTVGAGKVEFATATAQGADSAMRTVPVTVYARRSATLTAAASSAYGAKMSAAVNVRDVKTFTGSPVAAANVAVTLQRKAAGTSTWLNIGAGKTDAQGKAVVAFTNTSTGRLRAVVASTVPGASVLSAERSVTSVSTVSWSSRPSTVRSATTAYVSVYAKPYEKGSAVWVQARRPGGAWVTAGSASVTSTGYAKAAFKVSGRGTWELRVVRLGTTLRATGYSSTAKISAS